MMDSVLIVIILVGVVGVAFMAVSMFGIPVSPFQVMIAAVTLAALFLGGVAFYFLKDRKHGSFLSKDYITEALAHAIKWGSENGIELEYSDGSATTRAYPPDNEIFVGLKLHRKESDPHKPGLPVILVLQTNPVSVRDFHDNPGPQLLGDPFAFFSSGYSGAPTPKASPANDASFYQRDNMRRGNVFNIGGGRGEKQDDFFKRSGSEEQE